MKLVIDSRQSIDGHAYLELRVQAVGEAGGGVRGGATSRLHKSPLHHGLDIEREANTPSVRTYPGKPERLSGAAG